MKKLLMILICFLSLSCGPPPIENVYRKEGRYPQNFNVPVAFLTSEWAGEAKILASGWLIGQENGTFFSAKHFSDEFMNDIVELGNSECKLFINGKIYTCVVAKVPPLRDAVVLKIQSHFNKADLPKPYIVGKKRVSVGDKVFIQGFHPHSNKITESNLKDGYQDLIVPILKNFYQIRMINPEKMREVVFDNLEALVVDTNFHTIIGDPKEDSLAELKYKVNDYIKVVTVRNHKFSFGGLSGGVMLRMNEDGIAEAVGIVTAEDAVRFEHEENYDSPPVGIANTLYITPIDSVTDLYEKAIQIR